MKTKLRPLLEMVCAAVVLAPSTAALAAPMIYSATVVTDLRVRHHVYHNAAVTIRFVGNTEDIEPVVDAQGNPIPSTDCDPPNGWFYALSRGEAQLIFESNGESRVAHLSRHQIFVALDACNGGIGFGSFTGPNGLEPAYPLALNYGTAYSTAVNVPSGGSPAAILSTPANMSGNAWSCIGYPPLRSGVLTGSGSCTSPDAYPLHSDLGDLYIYQPYNVLDNSGNLWGNHVGSLNRGTFSISAIR